MHWLSHNPLVSIAMLFALSMLGMAAVGTVIGFSPVPYWDMWGATLGFYMAVADGNHAVWWAQHNEHRIVLSRLLFWLDYAFFGGRSVFLLTANFVIVLTAVATFFVIARQYLHNRESDAPLYVATAFLSAWLFQWMQEENLAWAFQSQFFLAQLLPLIALYLLSRAANLSTSGIWHFAGACGAGALAMGTMANGIITLPLMTLYAFITRMSAKRILALAALSVVLLTAYFLDYQRPGDHGSVITTLVTQPVELAHYVLLYLGTPFYVLAGEGETGLWAARISTVVMTILTLRALWPAVRAPRDNLIRLALIFYIVYLTGTALGTGSGRLIFGINQAVTYRYTTPALMAWAALLWLYLPPLINRMKNNRILSLIIAAALASVMLWHQTAALTPQHQRIFDRAVAMLALEMDVRDEPQINTIYVMDEGLINTVEVASAYDVGIFADYPWHNLREQIGRRTAVRTGSQCVGHLDQVSAIATEPRFVRIDGWLFSASHNQAPHLIRLVSATGTTAGFALTGQPRPDVRDAVTKEAYLAGLRGYLAIDSLGEPIEFAGLDVDCSLIIDVPAQI
ncbi:hypothetical protein [Pseudohongiella spirulinae]|uniref:Transmembrane protein n=1 Tax=Pseudohongiella spirulinae TaxID=1249552 RepID=A0A0S2KG75_9GAMM|nr:hypothetical protein [Pseudohongiella spirulinae]ALO47189.1 hypothetical protein PS2015_2555 [Pseudohongiella spirulinae]